MTTYLDDIEFVFLEVVRFKRMDQKELSKHHFTDLIAMLPHPSGKGQMICGSAAYRRLQDLAERAVLASQHAGCIEPQTVLKELIPIIVRRFLREKRELNATQASRAVGSAIRVAAKARADRTHFVPCHLGHTKTPESFSIGPVVFEQRSSVFERLEPEFLTYLSKDQKVPLGTAERENHREAAEKCVAEARGYYDSFGWIAQVAIGACDPPTSRQRAKSIVQSTLDCLHLLIGAGYSRHMRVGGPNFRTDRRGGIELNSSGSIELSFSVDWLSHNLGEGWWESVNSEGGDQLVTLMGVAIEAGYRLPRPTPLAQRFLDGAAWYGEAVRDAFGASSLIKYVTAIERIVTTKNDSNLVEVISNRGAALIFNPGIDNLETLRKRFRSVYNLRSRLVHGSRSPFGSGLISGIREAEELARSVLVRALQAYRQEGLETQKMTTQKQEEAYSKLLKWADASSSG